MEETWTIQLHANDAWHDVASVSLQGPASEGWRARTYSGYAVDWAFQCPGIHARNTAVQRDFKGRIALAPLDDFAPMFLHPDGIARRIRWEGNDDGRPDWGRVLDRVCELGSQFGRKAGREKSPPTILEREPLLQGLRAMAPALARVAAEGEALGLGADLLNHLRPGLLARAQELAALG